jgi:hypothetical protein
VPDRGFCLRRHIFKNGNRPPPPAGSKPKAAGYSVSRRFWSLDMTVSSEVSKIIYPGTGGQTEFAVPFYFLSNDDIKVILRDGDGLETLWLEGTHFALTGAGNEAGGQLTVSTGPTDHTPAAGEKLVIKRDLGIVQETDYPEGGAFPASAHEGALDRAAMIDQQTNERLDRALTAPESDTAPSLELPNETERAAKYLAFDLEGRPMAASGPTGESEIPVSAFMETVLDDTTAAAARTTLDAQRDVIAARGDIIRGGSGAVAERFAVGSTGSVLTSDGTDVMWAERPLPRGYLAGLRMSNDSDADHDISVEIGECRDAANGMNIVVPAAITKRIDATWSAGDDAGGLSSSLTAAANDTWYHVFAVVAGGAADVGFDTSVAAANLTADHGVTGYRRIGSVRTDGSANIVAFVQSGDWFWWKAPPLDVNDANGDTGGALATLSVPTGVRCLAKVNLTSGSGGAAVFLSDQENETINESAAPLPTTSDSGGTNSATDIVLTDTSAQVRYRTIGTVSIRVVTRGFMDRRGRDD